MPGSFIWQLIHSSDGVEMSDAFLSLVLFLFWPQEKIILLCHLATDRIVRMILAKESWTEVLQVTSGLQHLMSLQDIPALPFLLPWWPPAFYLESLSGLSFEWRQHAAQPPSPSSSWQGQVARTKNKYFLACLLLAQWYLGTICYCSVN